MKIFPDLSIRTQLLFLAILLALPSLVIIIYSGLKERMADIEAAAVESQKLAENIAVAQENITKEALQFGKLLAGLPEVKNRRPVEVQYILSNICKDNPQYLSIIITDRSGKAWASAFPITKPISVSDRRYFKNAQYSLRFSSGEFAISKTTGIPTLTMGYPLIAEDGDFDGVIALSFNLDRLKPILERSRLPEDTDYVVADHAGVIISRGQYNDRLVGSRMRSETLKYMEDTLGSSTYQYVRSDGDKRITTFRKLWLSWEEKPYMYVRAGISFDRVVAKSNRNLAHNIALLMPFVIVSFGLAFYIGKRSIADKVSLLESAARNLSEGNFRGKVTDLVKGGELGRLGLAFDDMASQLKVREKSISEHAIELEKEIIVRKKTEDALSIYQLQLEELNSFLEERVTATVNDLREKDKILVNQSRLAAMGEMINNIAHQWRQPLNNIGLIIQNIEYDYNSGKTDRDTLSKDITSAMNIVKYMSKTIDDFRNFFKIDKEKTFFSINKTISKAIDFMKSGLNAHNITTEVEFEDDVMVDGYENEYTQVLLNIINNAKDAFLEQKVNRPSILFKLTKENGRSLLRIRDNGGGIDPAILPKIFDPYFSTKFNTQGTGIGLYMSKMIIEQNMGGELTACNVENGAEFCVVV